MPGGRERFLRKALQLPADSLILDLEDAVAPAQKEDARGAVCSWLTEVNFGTQERIVRINPLDTPWGARDLEETFAAGPDAYLVPKVRSVRDVEELDARLGELEREVDQPPIPLLVLATETPEGLLAIADLARAPRVDALTWGPEDLAAALGAPRNRDGEGRYLDVFRYARSMTLIAAAAARIAAIDTVYVDLGDPEGLRREAREAAWMGFSGKLTLHPDQVRIVNEVFTPSPEEIAQSRELLERFEEHRRKGEGAFLFRGQMVDVPHLERARTVLARARQAGVE